MDEMQVFEQMVLEKKPSKCPECGEKLIFEGGGSYRCQKCETVVLDNFGKIKKYLDENGAASCITIARATGVRREIIEQMLKEGRLEIPDSSEYFIKCERCGCDIRYGRFCPECINKLAGGIKAIFNESVGEKPKQPGKMRFLDEKRKR